MCNIGCCQKEIVLMNTVPYTLDEMVEWGGRGWSEVRGVLLLTRRREGITTRSGDANDDALALLTAHLVWPHGQGLTSGPVFVTCSSLASGVCVCCLLYTSSVLIVN